jgi:hypothetical protein
MDTNSLVGALKSWTVYLGGVILLMPEWWPLVAEQVTSFIGSNATDKITRILGILVILVRFKTTKSLSEKGGA